MKTVSCKIVPYPFKSEPKELNLYITSGTADSMNIKNNTTVTLICGGRKTVVQTKVIKQTKAFDGLLWLSSAVFENLLLPREISVEITNAGTALQIGPVIGILIEAKLLARYMKGHNTREELDHYVDAGEKIGALVYIFCLQEVNLSTNKINGYIRRKDGKGIPYWEKRYLPVPDAIHNRIAFTGGSAVNEEIAAIKKIVPHLQVINRITKVDKWKVAQIVEKDPAACRYTPKTKLLKGTATIDDMLADFPVVYLKPIRRSLGLGVVKITKTAAGNYSAAYHYKRKKREAVGNARQVLASLNDLMGGRIYIVQQGISLAAYQGNPFDLRVTIQKGSTGSWSLSSWGARVAAPGNIITNVAAGGKGIPIQTVMTAAFGKQAANVMAAVEEAGIAICQAIGKKISGIGDLGLDIGVDEAGKPYLIEVNFRDYRLTDEEMDDVNSWVLTYHKPVFYLKYLYSQLGQGNL